MDSENISTQIKVAAVLPTFNRRDRLRIILGQLCNQALAHHIALDIIVCVDGSTDGTLEMIAEEFPRVEIVEGDGTWWYTRSMNEGFKFSQQIGSDLVLTLNDDLEIDENYVTDLVGDFYSIRNADAILGSLSISNDAQRLIQFAGIKRYRFNGFKSEYYIPALTTGYSKDMWGIYPTMELPGRGMLIPMRILSRLNYFDEEFQQYGSDTDFCLRARKLGIGVFISWNVAVRVNLSLTRIRSASDTESLRIFFRDLFNPNSHYSLKKYALFRRRHYGYLSPFWSIPVYISAHLWHLSKRSFKSTRK